MLLQIWYDLSDMGVEDMVHGTCLVDAFCGLRLEDTAPDHRTLSRFRSELSEKRALYRLPAKLNAPLAQHGVWVQQGNIIDTAITPTARQAHGKSTYILPEDPDTLSTKEIKSGVDRVARWVKKGNRLKYGYERHDPASVDEGLVLAVHTTAANSHDGQCMAACLDQVPLFCR